MKRPITWLGTVAFVLAALSGCGGSSDSGGAPPPNSSLAPAIAAAAGNPANDTSTNSSSAFKVLQDNNVPAVTVTGPPVVNFTVFSGGTVKQGLTLSNVSLAIAKLVPGTSGNIDQWQNYTFRVETTTGSNAVGSGPGGTPVLASAFQATTDPKPAAQANQLVYNAAGYYTYTFSTDITDPAKTNGVVFEPNLTHRVAIQLSYTDAAGQTIRVNPYFDVTFDANGRSVAVTDPSKTRVMADVSSCNGCHEKLALHGGGRVDVQFCVMCHNPGTTDANSGNVLTMMTMVHKIHSGRLLASQIATGGEDYVIWGFQARKHDYAEVGFPQDLRNCPVCHTGSNPDTPQGDNWKSRPSQEACLTCHANNAGSTFDTTHTDFALQIVGPGGKPKDIPNSSCAECHRVGASVSSERVHFNQVEVDAAKYLVNIESATFDSAARKVTVRYFVSDPTNNNARYNLVTPDCTGSGATLACSSNTRFGNLRFYLAYQNLVGQPTGVTEFTAFNNGSNVVINGTSYGNAYLYRGTNDGSNTYTVDILLAPDTPTSVAQGTARVVSIGQIKELELQAQSAADPRPPVSPPQLVNVVAQHTYADVALSGPLTPRRQVVANEKCNVCHGALGTTSGSNTLANAFHSGARNTVEACVVCHDPNRVSSTVMTSGAALQENYSFKRMIHGIHGNSKRNYPFTHGNPVTGPFDKAGTLLVDSTFLNDYVIRNFAPVVVPAGTPVPAGSTFLTIADLINTSAVNLGYTGSPQTIENYAAEVAYPQVGLNCNACHVNNSWQQDLGTVGAVVAKPIDQATLAPDANPLNWLVITPKAASCTACHDSNKAIEHVIGTGGSAFGTATQGQSLQTQETCADCHAVGRQLGVDVVHGQK